MTDTVQTALIVSIAPTLVAVGSLVRAEGVLEGRRMGVSENQSRVTESERVQDRADKRR